MTVKELIEQTIAYDHGYGFLNIQSESNDEHLAWMCGPGFVSNKFGDKRVVRIYPDIVRGKGRGGCFFPTITIVIP